MIGQDNSFILPHIFRILAFVYFCSEQSHQLFRPDFLGAMIVESIQMNAATPIGFNNSFEGEPVEDPEDVYDISDLDEDWHNNWIIKDIWV